MALVLSVLQQASIACEEASLEEFGVGFAVQIEMGSTNVRVGSTIFGARDYAKWTERPRDKEQDPESDSN